MSGFENNQNPNNEDRLRGEIIGSMAEWSDQYNVEGLELPYTMVQALFDHMYKHEEPTTVAEFFREAGKIFTQQADSIDKILKDDFQRKLN